MNDRAELATESVDSVKFSFLTAQDVRNYSFKQVTSVELLDNLDRPVPGGLYDPALGPLEDRITCKSCGQSSFQCPGHCGHIELISSVFNPLLFNVLFNILRKTCFFCHHFTDTRDQVEKCASQVELILKGDIVAANNGDVVLQNDLSPCDDIGAVHVKDTSDHSLMLNDDSKHLKKKSWTSLQYSYAMSLLEDFMKIRKKKCSRCKSKSPTITQPTFGWIHMKTSDSAIRRNVIRDSIQSSIDEAEQKFIIGGAENANDSSTREIETDDDIQSSGAVYDGTPNSSTKSHKDLGVGNVPSEFIKQKTLLSGSLSPSEVKDHIKLLWDNETQLCSLICDIHRERLSMSEKKRSYSMFFIDALLVPPVKFRPLTKGGDSVTHHPQTVLLSKVLQSNIDLCYAHNNNDNSKMVTRSLDLQQSVNVLFGNKKSFGPRDNMGIGICQILEKKDGIFRQKMMGKRVNYSCRSVISPDPYLAVNEIGIPPYFALKLTYPERVTPWNVEKLRNAILNGPDIHPGATDYSDQFATRKLSKIGKMRTSISKKLPSLRGDVTQPGRSVEHEHEGKVVYRHLQDGDIVLVNRQPTLHKPGIMAHVVRVLNGEKTLRMHYANCSTYNADFDGDEMNVHFPQDEIARAEAFHIVNANNQYIIPTSGDTKRGLIQDHIVSGVLLTKKDTFLSREEYTHLLYSSGLFAASGSSFVRKTCQKVSTIVSEDEIELIVPAILKPEPLWTGKQVITSLLNHMTKSEGLPPFTFEAKCTIDEDIWTSQRGDDAQFQIVKNNFLNGVIDKAQFGKYGMVHTVQELYGSKTAGALLSGLSRLFTVFLQLHGFTCGVDDLLLKRNVDIERRRKLKDADKIDKRVYSEFVNGKDKIGDTKIDLHSKPGDTKDKDKERKELQVCIEKKVRDHGESAISLLDMMMSSAANDITNAVNDIIFPKKTKSLSADKSKDKSNVVSADKSKEESADNSKDGLAENSKERGFSKPFPKNCFSLMTISGAKGGQVNFSQVSSLLGQQSLEGKRVPLMISGKTLPCFPPWDPALRAGGFITDCFLTGLRPQEYYFHCMAGREGLVDTAVKTSRSGYLQRCLVKNLECLMVGYDHTVRDADGSIVQFCYGEDGVDVHKTSFMTKFDTLTSNHSVILGRLDAQCKDELEKSEDDHLKFDKYIQKLPLKLLEVIYPAKKVKDGKKKSKKKEQEKGEQRSSLVGKSRKLIPKEKMMKLMIHKYLSSLAQPGEPVGVIAAQSVGEPSTQMTLNTFHHAGQKDSNVTLGIPRLQEILMRASEKIQTPIMSCALREGKKAEDAERLARRLRNVSVADVIKSMQVSVVPFSVQKHQASTVYKLKVELYPVDMYPEHSNIDLDDCEKTLKSMFVPDMVRAIASHVTMLSKIADIRNIVQKGESEVSGGTDDADPCNKLNRKGEENDGSEDEVEEEDLGFDAQKGKLQNSDEMEYEDGMENEYIEGEASGFESEIDQVELEDDNGSDVKAPTFEADNESKVRSKPKSSAKKLKSEAKRVMADSKKIQDDTGRVIYMSPAIKELNFEVHFRSTNEPHFLLSQIAQKAAKNVYVKKLAKIDRCSVSGVTKTLETRTPNIQTAGDTKTPEMQKSGDTKTPEIRTSGDTTETREKNRIGIETSGVDFHALWDMQDDLDIRQMESNDIHGILQTYGVEAARATIVKELSKVFDLYGIKTDVRHLSLIADFMTQSGKYRPMSRYGMADSISPFSKMSFETASTFILNAAYRGEVDNLESPSASICLGQPVKMGTGCFDLMQKVQV